MKTTVEDIDALAAYLKTQVGWVPLEKAKRTIDGRLVDARKLDACTRLGLLERDGTNIKLTARGREYATATDVDAKAQSLQASLREFPLYVDTFEWIHHSRVAEASKTDIANRWHDHHTSQLEGAQGAALTDAAIFFMKLAGAAALGVFKRGNGGHPDSYFKSDASAIERFVLGSSALNQASAVFEETTPTSDPALSTSPETGALSHVQEPSAQPVLAPRQIEVSTSPAVHVNVEIHIAADATAETVAEIFRNMRRYVLNNPDDLG